MIKMTFHQNKRVGRNWLWLSEKIIFINPTHNSWRLFLSLFLKNNLRMVNDSANWESQEAIFIIAL